MFLSSLLLNVSVFICRLNVLKDKTKTRIMTCILLTVSTHIYTCFFHFNYKCISLHWTFSDFNDIWCVSVQQLTWTTERMFSSSYILYISLSLLEIVPNFKYLFYILHHKLAFHGFFTILKLLCLFLALNKNARFESFKLSDLNVSALYDVQYDNVSNITEKCKKITVKE